MPDAEDDLGALRAGDEAAFTRLVDALHRPLVRLAEAFVGRGPTAEEIVQEAWLAVVDGIDKFEGRSTLKTWIGGIVANRARTRRAKDARELPFGTAADAEEAIDPARFRGGFWKDPPRWSPSPDDLLERRRVREEIVAAIEELPDGQRAVITLRDIEEWSSEEVCNVLGISETNQRVLLHRARSRLRMALERKLAEGARP
jgi:RNA polymerase sigma-70 factor (ECF subfamily)